MRVGGVFAVAVADVGKRLLGIRGARGGISHISAGQHLYVIVVLVLCCGKLDKRKFHHLSDH